MSWSAFSGTTYGTSGWYIFNNDEAEKSFFNISSTGEWVEDTTKEWTSPPTSTNELDLLEQIRCLTAERDSLLVAATQQVSGPSNSDSKLGVSESQTTREKEELLKTKEELSALHTYLDWWKEQSRQDSTALLSDMIQEYFQVRQHNTLLIGHCIHLIHYALPQFYDFSTTLECFQAELASKSFNFDGSNAMQAPGIDMIMSVCNKCADAFDRGMSGSFWYLWNQHVPQGIRKTDRKTQRLEFLLHVYFASLPFRKGLSSNDDMVKLKVLKDNLFILLSLFVFQVTKIYYYMFTKFHVELPGRVGLTTGR
jgi:hypothetical protein